MNARSWSCRYKATARTLEVNAVGDVSERLAFHGGPRHPVYPVTDDLVPR